METVVWAHGGATCRGHGTTAVRVSRQPQGGDASSLDVADDKGGRKRPKAKATEGKTAVIVRGPRRSRLARVKSPPASLERPGENPAGTSRGRAPASAGDGGRRVLWRSRWPRGGRACRSCCGRGRADTRPTRQSTARDTCNEAGTLQSPLRTRPRGGPGQVFLSNHTPNDKPEESRGAAEAQSGQRAKIKERNVFRGPRLAPGLPRSERADS